jgi:hypothetical protein
MEILYKISLAVYLFLISRRDPLDPLNVIKVIGVIGISIEIGIEIDIEIDGSTIILR